MQISGSLGQDCRYICIPLIRVRDGNVPYAICFPQISILHSCFWGLNFRASFWSLNLDLVKLL